MTAEKQNNQNENLSNHSGENKNEDYNFKKLKENFKFTNDKGYLRADLITEVAEEIAIQFKKDGLTKSQLRAFYNEVKALKNRLKTDKSVEKFEEVYPLILLMKSKIIYRADKDKKDKHKMAGLKEFFLLGIEHIKKENREGRGREAFNNFATMFEAIIGYSYGIELSE